MNKSKIERENYILDYDNFLNFSDYEGEITAQKKPKIPDIKDEDDENLDFILNYIFEK